MRSSGSKSLRGSRVMKDREMPFPVVNGLVAIEHVRYLMDELRELERMVACFRRALAEQHFESHVAKPVTLSQNPLRRSIT